MAAALKIFPAILGVLLLYDKKYKEAIRVIIYGVILFFFPFLFFNGGLNALPTYLNNLNLHNEMYNFRQYDRFNFRYWAAKLEDIDIKTTIYSIFPVCDIILSFMAIVMSCFHKCRWKTITQLILVIMILPVNSGKYVGLYLFVGIILFFSENEHSKFDWVYLVLFIFILNPYQLVLHMNGGKLINLTNYAMNISASIMFIILTIESTVNGIKKIKLLESC